MENLLWNKSSMKKIILLALLLFTINWASAQAEKSADKKVSEIFEQKFNSGDFNGIFDMFSTEMKNTLPRKKAIEFFTGIKKESGKIRNRKFKDYVKGTFASYKATFEKGIFLLNISTNKHLEITGIYIAPFPENNVQELKRNSTKLILPFKGRWTVFWGGDNADLNYHVESKAQKNAFDFLITDKEGKSYKTNGRTNQDYYAFGKEIIAPCDAEVVLAVDGIEDNNPGELNPLYIPGNTVILKTENGEYLFFAHFKQHSVKVKEGQMVKKGELLGLCGNSGNSSEPHLHFHIQNVKDMNKATGVKSYFSNIIVDGELRNDYSPIKGEIIENEPQD
jgi:murein DD-endopeptidase MepM/ murein hydrolase activator NlpD